MAMGTTPSKAPEPVDAETCRDGLRALDIKEPRLEVEKEYVYVADRERMRLALVTSTPRSSSSKLAP